jgi:invasion protein IalB
MKPAALAAFAALLTIAVIHPVAAEDAKRLGKFGDWESYAYTDGGTKVCYTAASAAKVQGGEKGRNSALLIVTHRPGAKAVNEVSVTGGAVFKKDSDVELQVGATKHSLFTKGDHAWAKDASADKAIVGAMLKGREMSVRATPAKGTALSGTISLHGFSDALGAIDKACAVKR